MISGLLMAGRLRPPLWLILPQVVARGRDTEGLALPHMPSAAWLGCRDGGADMTLTIKPEKLNL